VNKDAHHFHKTSRNEVRESISCVHIPVFLRKTPDGIARGHRGYVARSSDPLRSTWGIFGVARALLVVANSAENAFYKVR
jgi:hypothetical protein